jgi:hypothetical protein
MQLPKELKYIYGWNGTSFQPIAIDWATRVLTTITYEHHEIHGGRSFSAHFDNTTASSDDDVSAIGFKTANTSRWLHITFQASASNPAEAFILEGPTYVVSKGNHGTAYNRDRNSGNLPSIISLGDDAPVAATANLFTTFIEGEWNLATIASGTMIEHMILAGGEGPKAVGGVGRGAQEWILKPNTVYIFALQNIGATENIHEINIDWYEHRNKEK